MDQEDFSTSYPNSVDDGMLTIPVNDPISERGYYADFATAPLLARFGASNRFSPRVRGIMVGGFQFQRSGDVRIEFTDLIVEVVCASSVLISGSTLQCTVTMERLTTSISTVDVTSIITDTDLTSLSVSPASYATNSWTSNINTRILTLASSNSNTIGEPFTL